MDRDELLVVGRRPTVDRLMRALRPKLSRFAGAALAEPTDRVVLNVVGKRAGSVLSLLGMLGTNGDPRGVPPFASCAVQGHHCSVLLETDTCALIVVDAATAVDVRRVLNRAGRPYGITCVGVEAVERYVLNTRSANASVTLV